jgi:uncharacterized protein (TIGR03083 family)
MTDLVDASIEALRTNHDQLADLVGSASPDDLNRTSGATEWSVADVLSHLGSSSELWLLRLRAGIDGVEVGEIDNHAVWDRWNALAPEKQASAFLEHHGTFVETLESLDAEQRNSVQVDLGFMPAPAPLSQVVGMRLVETANHAWDARAGLDPHAGIEESSAALVLDSFAGDLSFMLGFSTKPDQLGEPAVIAADGYVLRIDDAVSVTAGPAGPAESPTATYHGPLEGIVRLMSGRLRPERTPEGVDVTGNVSLDDLRRVFPGY